MSDANRPDAGRPARPDTDRQRGEGGGGRLSRTASAAPKNPVAHDVPGNTGIDDIGARMVPASNGAGETTPGGTTAEGASGGAGLPGGTPPRDDDRKPKRV